MKHDGYGYVPRGRSGESRASWDDLAVASWDDSTSWSDPTYPDRTWAEMDARGGAAEDRGGNGSRRRVGLGVGLASLVLVMALPLGIALVPSGPAGGAPAALVATPDSELPPATSGDPTAPETVPVGSMAATVTDVIDGDTIDTDAGRIRFYGVDSPERGAAYSAEATAFVAASAPVGTSVWLWRAPGSDDRDAYGRLVRVVFTDDESDLNEALVAAGLARAYVRYSDRYIQTEETARAQLTGMWSSSATASPVEVNDKDAPAGDLATAPWNVPGPDLDCSDIGGPVRVLPPDYHRLDRDGDGWGCDR